MTRSYCVHQFTATLSPRDAVGHHTLCVEQILHDMGVETAIYAEHIDPKIRYKAHHFEQHSEHRAPDLIIYQSSIGSAVADYLLNRREPLVINYHNMTPSRFYYRWHPHLAIELDRGRVQLTQLARDARLAIADSNYNAADLSEVGMDSVEVVPVLIDDEVLPSKDDINAVPAIGRRSSPYSFDSQVTLLFVGRLAPNKSQQDLIAALAVLRRRCPGAELVLVGSATAESYEAALREFAVELGVGDAVRFVGSVSLSELVSWYRRADVFVCLSEHEGFCVPLVEAMAWGVPVIAGAAAAIPETLGGAGVLLLDKSPVAVATAIERVLRDAALREDLVSRGLERAKQLEPTRSRERLHDLFAQLIASGYGMSGLL